MFEIGYDKSLSDTINAHFAKANRRIHGYG